ncbi:MAG: ankyrin repeat protein [Francisellaceae bacterium]|nr:ankyrin repeat protein [Francisellaceae bacterium]
MYSLKTACKNGKLSEVNDLLNKGVDVTAKNNLAICQAAISGHLNIVKRLLHIPGVDVTDRNNIAVSIAACKGKFEIVEFLLAIPTVNVNADNNLALKGSVKYGHTAISLLICEHVRLRALADFFKNKQNLNMLETGNRQKQFKEYVYKSLGDIRGIEDIIKEKIIQKTFQEMSCLTAFKKCMSSKALKLPAELFDYIWEFQEDSYLPGDIERNLILYNIKTQELRNPKTPVSEKRMERMTKRANNLSTGIKYRPSKFKSPNI